MGVAHRPARALVVCPETDNVATALEPIRRGQPVAVGDATLAADDDIAPGHRIARVDIPSGEPVLAYGQPFGLSRGVHVGQEVSSQRVDDRLPETDYAPCTAAVPTDYLPDDHVPTFDGYVRADGRVGTRNYVLVVPTSMCAAHEAREIAEHGDRVMWTRQRYPTVDGVVAATHGTGCGCTGGPNVGLLMRTLAGSIDHPNVGAAVVIDLGCDRANLQVFKQYLGGRLDQFGKPVELITIQEVGGTRRAIERGIERLGRLIEHAAGARRETCAASRLVLATECGGSDGFSGLSANPATGACADHLVRCRGSVVLGEVPEMCGAEQLLTRRCRTPELAERLLEYSQWWKRFGQVYGTGPLDNPSPGNRAGGLVNIYLKSLGAVSKGGTTRVEDVVHYSERVTRPGLTLMQTPGYDQESVPGMVAGGATVCAFTTGRGSTAGNVICPVIKVASNTPMYQRLREDMDINAGTVLDGVETVDQVGRRLFQIVLDTASGRIQTCSEQHRHREFAVWLYEGMSL